MVYQSKLNKFLQVVQKENHTSGHVQFVNSGGLSLPDAVGSAGTLPPMVCLQVPPLSGFGSLTTTITDWATAAYRTAEGRSQSTPGCGVTVGGPRAFVSLIEHQETARRHRLQPHYAAIERASFS